MHLPPLPPSVTTSQAGLASLAVDNRHGRARIFLQGAHVAEWRPVGADEGLWLSVRSLFAPGKPIRGGIPICFPWFGPHPSRPDLPAHGFARVMDWTVNAARDLPDGRTRIELGLTSSPQTEAQWPHRFTATYAVTVGTQLELELSVRNDDGAPFKFEEALHTYLSVGDVRRSTVNGLQGARYVDKTDGGARKVDEASAVTFAEETDRLYLGTEATCTLADASLGREITVAKAGSRSTVVWNPWIAKAARMGDFGDHEWTGMACVETANASEDGVELAPGQSHRLWVGLSVARVGV